MSDCILSLIADGETKTYVCRKCNLEHRSRYGPEAIHRNCTAASKCPQSGPGSDLERFLKRFRFRVKRGCGCGDWVRWMNAIGYAGCREPANEAAINERLKSQAPMAPRWAVWLLLRWATRGQRF